VTSCSASSTPRPSGAAAAAPAGPGPAPGPATWTSGSGPAALADPRVGRLRAAGLGAGGTGPAYRPAGTGGTRRPGRVPDRRPGLPRRSGRVSVPGGYPVPGGAPARSRRGPVLAACAVAQPPSSRWPWCCSPADHRPPPRPPRAAARWTAAPAARPPRRRGRQRGPRRPLRPPPEPRSGRVRGDLERQGDDGRRRRYERRADERRHLHVRGLQSRSAVPCSATAVVSFIFNAALLALTVNIAASAI